MCQSYPTLADLSQGNAGILEQNQGWRIYTQSQQEFTAKEVTSRMEEHLPVSDAPCILSPKEEDLQTHLTIFMTLPSIHRHPHLSGQARSSEPLSRSIFGRFCSFLTSLGQKRPKSTPKSAPLEGGCSGCLAGGGGGLLLEVRSQNHIPQPCSWFEG